MTERRTPVQAGDSPDSKDAAPTTAGAPIDAASNARWLHALRNEVNVAVMSLAVARDMLDEEASAQALAHLRRAEAACYRCGELLRDADSRPH